EGSMIGEDIELDAGEVRFKLLQTINDSQHLLIVRRVVFLRWERCSRMKSRRDHGLVILSLAKVATESSIAGICYEHHRVWVVVINRLAHRVVLRQSFDIAESLIVLRKPFEFHTFASEA